ncbi:MAG: GSCFA domain-containing protein, partial [Bacteroidales bacterium]|nr:GSCFA domain-containing protein [Bacteroidales bacterium]
TYYFPAYEIMLDELRDYRFYAEDMVHPSELAVKYIFERFKETCINPAEYQKMQQNLKASKQSQHRQMM